MKERTEKTDWTRRLQLVLALIIALTGVGASWGASKAEVSTLKAQVVLVQGELKEAKEEVGDLRTDVAVKQNELENISKRLGEIQAQLSDLNKKIDNLRR